MPDSSNMQKKEGDVSENARIINEGIDTLQAAGEDHFINQAVQHFQASAAQEHPLPEPNLEIHLLGTESAKQVVEASNIVKLASVADAMASPYWDIIKPAMEDEMAGKIANKFAEVVKREPEMHVMKVKWVIFVALNDDGSVKKVKART